MRSAILMLMLGGLAFSAGAAGDEHADHQGMNHADMPSEQRPDVPPESMDHDAAGHGSSHGNAIESSAGHDHPGRAPGHTPVPEPTDEERAAAFPDLGGMDPRQMMDTPVLFFALLDQFEWVDAKDGAALSWDAIAWLGNDEQRLWLRSEGERANGKTEDAELQLLYGRPFARWWDWVVGMRHDFKPGPSQTWLAVGVQGLAPYWFETEATLFLGENGQSNLRLEVEYELLLTQRLVLQPLLELNAFGRDDAGRGIGSGLSSTEAGLRLRYEIRREFAPYVGLSWERRYGETADLAEAAGSKRQDTVLVAGLRLWF